MLRLALIPMVVGYATADSITVGDIRVTAMSSNLLRVEPKGPAGFENRTT